MRRLSRSLAVLTILAAATTPMPAHAGLLGSSCTTMVTQAGGSCTLSLAGPNFYVEAELEGSTTSPSYGDVSASLLYADDVVSGGMSCSAQGMFQVTRMLRCTAFSGPGGILPAVAQLPVGAPLTCRGLAFGSTNPGRVTCSTRSI